MGEPRPPNPRVKQWYAKGAIPKKWGESWARDEGNRCLCSHREGAHGPGGCTSKLCRRTSRCQVFRADPAFTLPAHGSIDMSRPAAVVPAVKS